jgi:hypothetical protein
LPKTFVEPIPTVVRHFVDVHCDAQFLFGVVVIHFFVGLLLLLRASQQQQGKAEERESRKYSFHRTTCELCGEKSKTLSQLGLRPV